LENSRKVLKKVNKPSRNPQKRRKKNLQNDAI
jgi:hypothetical protein